MPVSKLRKARLRTISAVPTVIVRLPASLTMSFMELSGKLIDRTRMQQPAKFGTWLSSGGDRSLGAEMSADRASEFANR